MKVMKMRFPKAWKTFSQSKKLEKLYLAEQRHPWVATQSVSTFTKVGISWKALFISRRRTNDFW